MSAKNSSELNMMLIIGFVLQHATPYSFQYLVDEAEKGLYFGQKESSDGETVTGIYRVALPDGRLQTVKYTADDTNGYVATVTYEHGPAHVPDSYPAPIPYHHNYRHQLSVGAKGFFTNILKIKVFHFVT